MKKFEKAYDVTEHTDAMLAFWDRDLVCRFANSSYLKWFGLSPADLVDTMTLPQLLGPLYQLNLPFITNALQGKRQIFQRDITLPSGETKHTIATYTPEIRQGIVIGFYAHVADISSVKNEVLSPDESSEDYIAMSVAHNYLNGVEYTLRSSLFTKFPGITALTKKYFVSPTKLKKDFKAKYKLTIFAYYRYLQMQVADKYIKGRIYSKNQLAEMFRFDNPSNFSTCYKKYLLTNAGNSSTPESGGKPQNAEQAVASTNSSDINVMHQRLTEQLKVWEKRADFLKIGTWEIDFETRITSWNPVLKNILELSQDFEPGNSPALNFYKEGEDRTIANQCLDAAFTQGLSFDFSASIITAKGNEKKVRVVGFCQFENGTCEKIFGTFQEIF